ncbi:MAG TPA: hypothetical protein VNT26_19965, partial [Candidatus Sulfotelmatobacter sp.]|nr:hypothetical protein [Candidatus Sulfotelmatobacter sp.]
ILDANASSGLDTIAFQIAGTGIRTIAPLSALPNISSPVVIDGSTQPGYNGQPLIELNGALAGSTSPGLRLLVSNCTIRALAINRFGADGIRIEGQGPNWVQGNVIGADPTGAIARGNLKEGIFLYATAGNLIGGTNAGEGNVIGGNEHGIYLLNGGSNVVQGNLIGTAATGTTALGNLNNGVVIYNSRGNWIGGTASGARNLISGNRASGIYLNGSSAAANLVQGNFIGTTLSGNQALGNGADGISVVGAPGNLLGGTNVGEGNLISGNAKAGVALLSAGTSTNLVQGNFIGTDALGRTAIGNGTAGIYASGVANNLIGGTIPGADNLISGNRQDGIFLSTNSVGNVVAGNFIGTDATGTSALANLFSGISLSSANSNTIGGAGSGAGGARNVISGNAYHGVQLAFGATGNTIQGNFIGTDLTGYNAVSNTICGLRLESPANLIGGSLSGAGNLISGNGSNGVYLVNSLARSNVLQGNYIGTTISGTGRLPNWGAGVGLSDAPYNLIGGSVDGAGNLISANDDAGISILGTGAAGNQILGNTIGADLTGTLALGNTLEGIYLEDCSSNLIGGSVAGAGNLISANYRGIYLVNASWNLLQGNLVGTKIDGTSPLGNATHNIDCDSGSLNNTFGGGAGAGNRIAYAQNYTGVRIRAGSYNNRIDGNAIFGNFTLGIDLGTAGLTANDACDADTGANQQQNFPVLTQAVSGNATGIRGTLNSKANSSYLLQFFASPTCDSSGNGEGQIYLGDASVVTAANCNAAFLARFPVQLPVGYVVTATATDAANNTSEFAACARVGAVPQVQLILSSAQSDGSGAGGTQQVTVTWTNTATGFVLKQTDSLVPPSLWTTVTNTPTVLNGQFTVSLPAGTGKRFYALSFE